MSEQKEINLVFYVWTLFLWSVRHIWTFSVCFVFPHNSTSLCKNLQVFLYYIIHEWMCKINISKTYSSNKSLIFKIWASVLHQDVQVFDGMWLTFTKQPSLMYQLVCSTEPCGKIPFGKGRQESATNVVHSL